MQQSCTTVLLACALLRGCMADTPGDNGSDCELLGSEVMVLNIHSKMTPGSQFWDCESTSCNRGLAGRSIAAYLDAAPDIIQFVNQTVPMLNQLTSLEFHSSPPAGTASHFMPMYWSGRPTEHAIIALLQSHKIRFPPFKLVGPPSERTPPYAVVPDSDDEEVDDTDGDEEVVDTGRRRRRTNTDPLWIFAERTYVFTRSCLVETAISFQGDILA